jgi:hypothetical protein
MNVKMILGVGAFAAVTAFAVPAAPRLDLDMPLEAAVKVCPDLDRNPVSVGPSPEGGPIAVGYCSAQKMLVFIDPETKTVIGLLRTKTDLASKHQL